MRQAVFAVLLLAAAFLGGAIINGPALRWGQDLLFDYLGLKDGGEIASIDPPKAPGDGASADRAATAAGASGAGQSPASKTETASTGSPPTGRAEKNDDGASPGTRLSPGKALASALGLKAKPDDARPGEKPTTAEHGADGSLPPLPIPPEVPEPAAPAPAEAVASSSSATSVRKAKATGRPPAAAAPATPGLEPPQDAPPPAPIDPSVGQALLASFSPTSSSPPTRPEPPRKPDAISLEVAPAPQDASARPGPSASTAPAPRGSETGTSHAGPDDWAALRRKMQSLGVTKYTIEGEPGGRVHFSCLIPLAGRQAVSQRFEAEGDDELHAAGLALRRITLWRASHSTRVATP
jgi:hypothetical protein